MMQCRKGHWYDASLYRRCPDCYPEDLRPYPTEEEKTTSADDSDDLLTSTLVTAESLLSDPDPAPSDPSPGFEGFGGGDSGGGGASDDFSGGSSDSGGIDS